MNVPRQFWGLVAPSEVEATKAWHSGHAKCATCKCCVSAEEHGPFRDALSFKEFGLSGMCQKCQDDFFGVEYMGSL